MIYLFAALAVLVPSNMYVIYLLIRNKKVHLQAVACWRNEKQSLHLAIIELKQSVRDMEQGWFPATYDNCRRRFGASFKFKKSRVPVNDRVNYFMDRGINFFSAGVIPYEQLLIRIPV